jgi:hypothetical protein
VQRIEDAAAGLERRPGARGCSRCADPSGCRRPVATGSCSPSQLVLITTSRTPACARRCNCQCARL